ncbi:MAG: hypothetical protein AB8G77_05095 [Rhodothermales bacterium]
MSLLAVDLGLKTGLACYGKDGRLQWYRSRNFGSRARLRKAAGAILREFNDVEVLVIEGGGDIAIPWIGEAERRGLRVLQLQAGIWRKQLLLSRHQRSGKDAKKHADKLARNIIQWSGAKNPTSLRHDAAEAICIGLWGVNKIKWLAELPGMFRV